MSFPVIKKYPHHSDLIFCRVPLLHTFPDNILTKYSREKLSYTEVHVFSKHNTFLGHFQFLICHALARAPGTEKGKKKTPKTKGTHLVLGLLQVVGTVKKLKALILVLGLLLVVGTVKIKKILKALILVLGLLQLVGTVKIQLIGMVSSQTIRASENT